MKTALFDFALPDCLIAQYPATPRDSARMLVVADSLSDHHVSDLPHFIDAGDVVVFNDTKVIPARLLGHKGASRIEILLHKRLKDAPIIAGSRWECFARPAKKLRLHDRIAFADDFAAQMVDKLASGQVILHFNESPEALLNQLDRYGHMPLPPYMDRADDASDKEHYQTVYAQHNGSVAAPTAGLHFTPQLIDGLKRAGAQCAYVTLHVGGGTFLPVKSEDTDDHLMHSEYAEVTPETAEMINQAVARGGKVIAVGTTSLRTLESASDALGIVHPFRGETSIFITPGYRFKRVDRLLTNFHLPRSTLFMLVSAFSGLERMQKAYAHAIAQGYRFYSYGDACLLMPER